MSGEAICHLVRAFANNNNNPHATCRSPRATEHDAVADNMIDVHLTQLLHMRDLGSSTLVMTPQLPQIAFVPSHFTARDVTLERNHSRMLRLAALSDSFLTAFVPFDRISGVS